MLYEKKMDRMVQFRHYHQVLKQAAYLKNQFFSSACAVFRESKVKVFAVLGVIEDVSKIFFFTIFFKQNLRNDPMLMLEPLLILL